MSKGPLLRSVLLLRGVLRKGAPLLVLVFAGALAFGVAAPASAQFFDFGFGNFGRRLPPRPQPPPQQRERGGFGSFFAPFTDRFPGNQPPPPPPPRVDYSRAPAPQKREEPAERNVLVLGDAMADWLAYGLEDALAETPELGVIRKHKTISGLIRYQPKGEPADWIAAAKDILRDESPDAIVVMLGLSDRMAIHEPVKKPDPKPAAKGKKGAKGETKKEEPHAGSDAESAAKTNAAKTNNEDDGEAPGEDDEAPAAPAKTTRAANGIAEFRDERWIELYSRKIEEMITVLKSKGVPVLWVGLPAVRGTKSTSDMLFLNALYRDVAAKTGITYVDVWDGFVDDAGRFLQTGPDFEGQIRRLRTPDGVYFTKAGARKLAHYAEREIRRVLASRLSPMALPSDPGDGTLAPGAAGPRPLAGPVVPLVASSVGTRELLGGVGTRPAAVDPLAARTLVKGEPLTAPAGRADDFSWPRREVGEIDAPETDSVATAAPASATQPAPKPQQPARSHASSPHASSPHASSPHGRPAHAPPSYAPPPQTPPFYGWFGADPGRSPPPQQARRDAPRPPADVGRRASPPNFFSWW